MLSDDLYIKMDVIKALQQSIAVEGGEGGGGGRGRGGGRGGGLIQQI